MLRNICYKRALWFRNKFNAKINFIPILPWPWLTWPLNFLVFFPLLAEFVFLAEPLAALKQKNCLFNVSKIFAQSFVKLISIRNKRSLNVKAAWKCNECMSFTYVYRLFRIKSIYWQRLNWIKFSFIDRLLTIVKKLFFLLESFKV